MKQAIPEYKFRLESEAFGFEMVPLSYFMKHYDTTVLSKPHRIDFYFILFLTEGSGVHEIDFKTFNYKKGDYIFVRQGQVHAWKELNEVEGYMFFFTADFFSRNHIHYKDLSFSYPFNTLLHGPVISTITDSDFKTSATLTAYIIQEFRANDSNVKEEILRSLLRTLLLKIQGLVELSKPTGSSESRELFVKFHRMLEKKLSESRNVVDYCEWLAISYDKLNGICKELTNKTVKHYIDEVIILRAKSLLLDQHINISHVAYSVGFEEPTNFTKFFKKHTQLSPKEFQKRTISSL